MKSKTEEVVLCSECKGTGSITKEELVDYHRVEYIYTYHLCKKCNGAGRLKITTEITTEPYDNPVIKELVFNKLQGIK